MADTEEPKKKSFEITIEHLQGLHDSNLESQRRAIEQANQFRRQADGWDTTAEFHKARADELSAAIRLLEGAFD